jgi:hypothetical protein
MDRCSHKERIALTSILSVPARTISMVAGATRFGFDFEQHALDRDDARRHLPRWVSRLVRAPAQASQP